MCLKGEVTKQYFLASLYKNCSSLFMNNSEVCGKHPLKKRVYMTTMTRCVKNSTASSSREQLLRLVASGADSVVWQGLFWNAGCPASSLLLLPTSQRVSRTTTPPSVKTKHVSRHCPLSPAPPRTEGGMCAPHHEGPCRPVDREGGDACEHRDPLS